MQTIKEAQAIYNPTVAFDQVVFQALGLPPLQKVQLVEKLMRVLEKELATVPEASQPRRSLYGMLAHLGPAPSAEEIDQARAEAWANFPHNDL